MVVEVVALHSGGGSSCSTQWSCRQGIFCVVAGEGKEERAELEGAGRAVVGAVE